MYDENECSHALVDRIVQIYDENVLTYVDWSTCTSRLEELSGVKHVKELKADAAGFVKERVLEVRGATDTSTDLLIRYALTRRGIAMELGQVISYTVHEHLINMLFREYLRAPPLGTTGSRLIKSGEPTSRSFGRCRSSPDQECC